MNPLTAVRVLPALEGVVASRYFSRYIVVVVLVVIAYIFLNKYGKTEG